MHPFMKQSFSIFLAFKYLKPKRSFLSVVTLLSLTGVFSFVFDIYLYLHQFC